MKRVKKLGFSLSLVGLIMYIPPVMKSVTLLFGETIARFGGVVSFAVGWAILGAALAFSAGFK
ncbi:MAG: hypothetical protein P8012_11160, partial [Desulfobacterales bacterium]